MTRLQIVEGIGPKVEEALNSAGIYTWGDIHGAGVEKLTEILAGAGLGAQKPATWPQQAQLADEAKWEELVALQKRLDGGVDTGKTDDSPAKVTKFLEKIK